jgi:hypothetical protein
MNEDFSKEIYEIYYNSDKLLKITLQNGEIIVGRLVGYFHGDPDESYIVQWHLLEEDKANETVNFLNVNESDILIIKQSDIKSVDFK